MKKLLPILLLIFSCEEILNTLNTDITAPTVLIIFPINESTLTAITTIRADVTDDSDIANVKFLIDGSEAYADTTSPYEYEWDVCVLGTGSHTVLVKAEDSAGNKGLSDIFTFTIDASYDCADVCGGDAAIDICEVCNGGISDITECTDCPENITIDCADVCGGDAILDECGECGGDGIPDDECDCDGNVLDCVGDCGGFANIDACNICSGDGSSCCYNDIIETCEEEYVCGYETTWVQLGSSSYCSSSSCNPYQSCSYNGDCCNSGMGCCAISNCITAEEQTEYVCDYEQVCENETNYDCFNVNNDYHQIFTDNFNSSNQSLSSYSSLWDYDESQYSSINISNNKLIITGINDGLTHTIWDNVIFEYPTYTILENQFVFIADIGIEDYGSENFAVYGLQLWEGNSMKVYYLFLQPQQDGDLYWKFNFWDSNNSVWGELMDWELLNSNSYNANDINFKLIYNDSILMGFLDNNSIFSYGIDNFACAGYGIYSQSDFTIWVDNVEVYGNETSLGRLSRNEIQEPVLPQSVVQKND